MTYAVAKALAAAVRSSRKIRGAAVFGNLEPLSEVPTLRGKLSAGGQDIVLRAYVGVKTGQYHRLVLSVSIGTDIRSDD